MVGEKQNKTKQAMVLCICNPFTEAVDPRHLLDCSTNPPGGQCLRNDTLVVLWIYIHAHMCMYVCKLAHTIGTISVFILAGIFLMYC